MNPTNYNLSVSHPRPSANEKKISLLGKTFTIATDCDAHFFGFEELAQLSGQWKSFFLNSPDRCIYHGSHYLEFASRENGFAGILGIEKEGEPFVAIPIHPKRGNSFTTGYSGILFAPLTTEKQLRKRIDVLEEFLFLNSNFNIEIIQSAQAVSYKDGDRRNMLSALLAEIPNLKIQNCYSRVVDLSSYEFSQSICDLDVSVNKDVEKLLQSFEGEVRSQVRKALRSGLQLNFFDLSVEVQRNQYFEGFIPVHEESWERTGMHPHTRSYLEGLSLAVINSGGRDLGVTVNFNAEVVAAVNVHVFGGNSLYWSGCSSDLGKSMNGNPLALLGGMIAARHYGAEMFEIGRFSPSEKSLKERAITAYKAQFGGVVIPIFKGEKISSRQLFIRNARQLIAKLLRTMKPKN